MKIQELARELNQHPQELISFLREMGVEETIAKEFPSLFMNDVLPVFVKNAIGAMEKKVQLRKKKQQFVNFC